MIREFQWKIKLKSTLNSQWAVHLFYNSENNQYELSAIVCLDGRESLEYGHNIAYFIEEDKNWSKYNDL